MACQVILEFRTKDGCLEKAREWFKQVLPETRATQGCGSIYLINNQDDPLNILVIEQWDSRELYEAYLAQRGAQGIMKEFADLTEGELSIQFFDSFGV
jgi:quinol monooxygenase YgiN